MKKMIAMFSLLVVLCCSIGATTVKAQPIEGTPDDGTRTWVRITKDNVKIKNEPFPWSKVIFVANKGDEFLYRGNTWGHYHIDITSTPYATNKDFIAFVANDCAETFVR